MAIPLLSAFRHASATWEEKRTPGHIRDCPVTPNHHALAGPPADLSDNGSTRSDVSVDGHNC